MIENQFRARYREAGRTPLILAHRGDSFYAPENTLEAAQLGFTSGADAWELDVHLTKDGIPVVIHDESLSRTTDVSRAFEGDPRSRSDFPVGDFFWEEIQELDAGSWFVNPLGGFRSALAFGTLDCLDEAARSDYGSGRVRIPTLAEALDWTFKAQWMVNVEIKPAPEERSRVVASVLAAIRSVGMVDRVTVSSFDHPTVAMVSKLEPDLATGLLISEPLSRPPDLMLREFEADAIHASVSCCFPGKSQGERSLLGPWGRVAVPVLVYTVNEAGPSSVSDWLAEAGATGWFTDDPRSFRNRTAFNPS